MTNKEQASKYLSVVIPAFNCATHLKLLLEDLQNQSYPKEYWDILIVDDGSTDNTAEIAQQFGAKVHQHTQNLGRVLARENGAQHAQHQTLVFIDARLRLEKHALENVVNLNYLPVMGVGTSDKYLSIIDRVFYCIRRKTYHPYEPQSCYGKELWIRKDEFDGRPKGTGFLAIDKDMFLNCALKEKYQDVSDDTKLLKNIVTKGKDILRHTDVEYQYEHRQNWPELIRHTFFRGPKFLDYYLVPGGPLFKYYLVAILITVALISLFFIYPISILYSFFITLSFFIIACIWMSEDIGDFLCCLVFFPPIATAFLSGIVSAQFSRLLKRRSLIRH